MSTKKSPAKISVKVKIEHGESFAKIYSTSIPSPDVPTPMIGKTTSAVSSTAPMNCATLGGSMKPTVNSKLKDSRKASKCSMCKTYDCEYPI